MSVRNLCIKKVIKCEKSSIYFELVFCATLPLDCKSSCKESISINASKVSTFQCNIHNTVRKYTKDHVQINQQCKLTRNLPCLMFLLNPFLELKIYFNIFICHSSKETSQNWALGILSGSITFIPFTCRV